MKCFDSLDFFNTASSKCAGSTWFGFTRCFRLGNQFCSEDIHYLCEFVQKESILFTSLLIDDEHLSEEDKALIASTMIAEVKETTESHTERCSICTVM